MIDPLDPTRIEEAWTTRGVLAGIEVRAEVGSTSDVALERLRCGDRGPFVVAAERQTRGRGRRGATWRSPPNASLAFSVARVLERDTAELAGLSLAAGVAIVDALEREGVRGLALKWPNDLLVGGAKAGGVLIETVPAFHGIGVVVGVGMNVRIGDEERALIDQPVADLATACSDLPDRSILLAIVAANIIALLEAFERDGFSPWIERWLARHAWQGAEVHVLCEETIAGRVSGIGADGALIITTADGPRALHAGAVSLRRR